MDNKQIIEKFYRSFAASDAEGMISCYADNIEFRDPAFGALKGNEVKNMWRMLLRNPGIKITYDNVKADDKTGSANWIAEYVFSRTGRKVINKVSATFEFRDGRIIKHTDRFNLWKWSGQALGSKGYLLGWTPMIRKKIQQQTNALLKKFSV